MSDIGLRDTIRRYCAAGGDLIHCMWQQLRKLSRDLLRLQSKRLRDLSDLARSEYLLQLLRRNRQVLPGADPRSYDRTEAAALERLHQLSESPAGCVPGQHLSNLLDQRGGRCSARRIPIQHTRDAIEKSHDVSHRLSWCNYSQRGP